MSDASYQPGDGGRGWHEFLASIIGSTAVQAEKDLVVLMNQRPTFSADSLKRMQLYEKLAEPLNARWKTHRNELALVAYLEVATELLGLYLPGNPEKGTWCYEYDRALEANCYSLQDDDLLDEAIRLGREALALQPTGHPDRAATCALLANLLAKYAAENDDEALLREVIQLDREVLLLRPIGQPDRDEALRDLAASLTWLSLETENASWMEEVMSLERDVVDLQPPGHPRRPASCASLSASLGSLYGKSNARPRHVTGNVPVNQRTHCLSPVKSSRSAGGRS